MVLSSICGVNWCWASAINSSRLLGAGGRAALLSCSDPSFDSPSTVPPGVDMRCFNFFFRRRVRVGEVCGCGDDSSAVFRSLRVKPPTAEEPGSPWRWDMDGTRTTCSVCMHSKVAACHTFTIPFTSAEMM